MREQIIDGCADGICPRRAGRIPWIEGPALLPQIGDKDLKLSVISGLQERGMNKFQDKYQSFAELSRNEREGKDFRIVLKINPNSNTAILAIHGRKIEPGTSEIARAIADSAFSRYCFEGLKPRNNFKHLHITSTNFDEPNCRRLVRNAENIVAIHGCGGNEEFICVGGKEKALRERIADDLEANGYDVRRNGHRFQGLDCQNICNQGRNQAGVQLELSKGLRREIDRTQFAEIIRSAIREHDASKRIRGARDERREC